MQSSWTSRKAGEGPCLCDDCGKHMQWKGVDWCITNNGYLLCSACMRRWVRENRYHRQSISESTEVRALYAAA